MNKVFFKTVFTLSVMFFVGVMGYFSYGAMKREYKITENAVMVPQGKILLIETDSFIGAVQFTTSTSVGDGGYTYNWYYSSAKKGKFESFGQGVVFEKYIRKEVNGKTHITDDGGQLFLKIKDFKIVWSSPTWVYFNTAGATFKFAPTEATKIEQVNYLDKNIEWKRWGQVRKQVPGQKKSENL